MDRGEGDEEEGGALVTKSKLHGTEANVVAGDTQVSVQNILVIL